MFRLYHKFITPGFLKFATVGASGSVLSVGITYLFTDIVHFHYMISYAIAFVVSVTSNYLLNSMWTFRQPRSWSAIFRYAGISLCTLGINEIVVFLLTSLLGLWYIFSVIISIGVAFLVNYTLSRKIVWTSREAQQ